MGVTLTDVLLFGKAQYDDIDNATLVIYRRNILRWSALGGYLDIIVKGVSPLSLPDAVANSLSYVKAFGGTEQRNLPDGYIQRQFIYMMEGSYLLTDIVPTYDSRVEMDFQTTTLPSGSVYLLGGRTVTYGGIFFAQGGAGVCLVDAFGTSSGDRYISSVLLSNVTRYKFTFNNKVASLESGGTTLFTNTSTGTLANGAALVINGLNSNGTVSGAQAGIYLYSFKVWNAQGELVMDLVPAVQKGTVPVVGFYDTVSGTFKTATAGTFAAGGEAVPTPDTPMDIVSNNGVLKYSRNKANVIADNVAIGKYISAQGVLSDSEYNFTYMPYVPVKPNTTYTLSFSSPLYFASVSEYSSAEDAGFVIRQTKYSTSLNEPFDLTEFTFTTGATTNYVRFGSNMYKNQSLAIDDVLALNYMLAESATAVPYAPYVSVNGGIYTDGTVETINVHGKNLFDKDQTPYQSGYYVANTTVVGNNIATLQNSNYNIYKIEVRPNTTYTFGKIKATNPSWAVVDSNDIVLQTGINDGGTDGRDVTITTDATAKYLYLSVAVDGTYKCDDILQLEQGSTATTYEPYFNGGTATAEMLLKVGDYQDVQSIIDGVVTRNVGVKVLDGTETGWTKLSGVNYVSLPKTAISNMVSGTDATCLSNNFVQVPHGSISLSEECFSVGASYMNFKKSGDPTVAQFKQWLANQYAAGTPVIVLYPLATPTTESVTGQTLQVTNGDNVLEITQASLSGLELEAEYQAAVSLTIQEVQDANLDPNVEVTIN